MVAWSHNGNLDLDNLNDSDILVALSPNRGAGWTYPEFLNTNALVDGTVGDGLGNIAFVAGGNAVVVWTCRFRPPPPAIDSDIFVARFQLLESLDPSPTLLHDTEVTSDFDDLGSRNAGTVNGLCTDGVATLPGGRPIYLAYQDNSTV